MVDIHKNQLEALSKDYNRESDRQAAHDIYLNLMNEGVRFPYMDTRMIIDGVLDSRGIDLTQALSAYRTTQEIIKDMGYEPSTISMIVKKEIYSNMLRTNQRINELFAKKIAESYDNSNSSMYDDFLCASIPVSELSPKDYTAFVTMPIDGTPLESRFPSGLPNNL